MTVEHKPTGMAHGMQLLDFWGTATGGVCVDRHAFSAAAASAGLPLRTARRRLGLVCVGKRPCRAPSPLKCDRRLSP